MTDNIQRRSVLAAGLGGLTVLTLGGCSTQSDARKPHYAMVFDQNKCVGCKYCIAACQYDARYINEETNVADNCDYCLQDRKSHE